MNRYVTLDLMTAWGGILRNTTVYIQKVSVALLKWCRRPWRPLKHELEADAMSELHDEQCPCLCASLAQCALSLKRLSAGPGFNPQTRQNKLLQDYWRGCFEINFSDRQEGLTVSSIICDR